ncbi:hypothetical protein LC087_19100 (plasmid) [Bacillus carboniphilus]|uniref:Uncharacterized protein n=1 Tax=Bacillus carboniphilus TaxID=86663 RepID=A0ABY9K3C7_9BACI|nr:hypothetical protein [Bacillus carboniphilus]WLR44416.1 hypothetical protein LC087_19100 [Bacillus carboniphilus]
MSLTLLEKKPFPLKNHVELGLKARRSTYTALESVKGISFHWDLAEILEFDKLWKEGMKQQRTTLEMIVKLSAYFERSATDVLLLVIDRAEQGKLGRINDLDFLKGTDNWPYQR